MSNQTEPVETVEESAVIGFTPSIEAFRDSSSRSIHTMTGQAATRRTARLALSGWGK